MGISRKLFLALALVLYAVLILFLINLHFNSEAQDKKNIDYIQIITKSKRKWMEPDQLNSVIINFYNMQIEISHDKVLELKNKTGPLLSVTPLSISCEGKLCTIKLTDNCDLSILANAENKDSLEITLNSASNNQFTGFNLFYSFPRETIQYAPTIPIIFLPQKNRHFFLSAKNRFETNTNQMIFSEQNSKITMNKTEGDKIDLFTRYINENLSFITNLDYQRLVSRFFQSSINNGNEVIINQSDKAPWLLNDKEILAQLSESIKHNYLAQTVSDYKQKINLASDYRPETVNYRLASSYFGNLENYQASNVIEDKKLADEIDHLIKTKNPELLSSTHLFNHLLNHGNISIIDEILSNIVIPYDPANYNAEATINLLYLYHDLTKLLPDKARFFQNTDQWLRSIIQRNCYITGNKLFLINSGDTSTNNLLNIRAGSMFISEGKSQNNPVFTQIGQSLIASVINLKTIFGYIPETYDIFAPGKSPKKKLSWGEIYFHLKQDSIWPKEQSMYPDFNPGTYLFSLCTIKNITITEILTITLENPVKTAQYILIQGLTKLEKLKINKLIIPKIEWYQAAYEGWNYDEKNQSLYIKTQSPEDLLILELFYKDKAIIDESISLEPLAPQEETQE
ncbi:MAG: hypothetical protein JXR70_11115 [Spirochaetales bacterium]|nr:hypothetical protein [Spirochaetales bacterium]